MKNPYKWMFGGVCWYLHATIDETPFYHNEVGRVQPIPGLKGNRKWQAVSGKQVWSHKGTTLTKAKRELLYMLLWKGKEYCQEK